MANLSDILKQPYPKPLTPMQLLWRVDHPPIRPPWWRFLARRRWAHEVNQWCYMTFRRVLDARFNAPRGE